jgi:hypothetical protein
LVISSPVWNPPQKRMPNTNETLEIARTVYWVVGVLRKVHNLLIRPVAFSDMSPSG